MPGPVGFSGLILWWVRIYNDFEVNSEGTCFTWNYALLIYSLHSRQQVNERRVEKT